MGVNEKLLAVQKELKAPKGQYNSFGRYNYRSCEDILEGVKPLLSKHKATLYISDSLELIGTRFYVKATVKFVDVETNESIENSAYAREEELKKGMDSSQVTGATSSYARKYALNGLFLIDDTKDADTDAYQEQQVNASKQETQKKSTKSTKATENKSVEKASEKNENFNGMNPPEDEVDQSLIPKEGQLITPEQLAKLQSEMERTGVSLKQVLTTAKVEKLEDIHQTTAVAIINKFARTGDKKG